MTNPPYPGDLLEHLRALIAVAARMDGRGGTFSRASADLALDTSVLRRRVQSLEAWANAPLVQGRGPRMRLTDAGEALRSGASRALEMLHDTLDSITERSRILRVACTGTFATDALPIALRELRKKHPRLAFRVRRAGSTLSRELLGRDEVDLAIMRGAEPPPGLDHTDLGADRLWLITPRSHALARVRAVSLAEIAAEPLVGYGAASFTMERVMNVLGPLGASIAVEVEGKASALAWVRAGFGVGFVSLVAGQKPEGAGVTARNVTHLFARASFWLVRTKGRVLSAWEEDFVAIVRR